MSLKFPAAWTFLLALGCHDIQVQPLPPDLSPSVDLAPPAPPCAAAKGLSGDALLCVDFNKLSGLTDQALMGWDFKTNCGAGWEINGGKLQVKNFGSFVGTCSFSMPLTDLSSSANLKFQSVTLAVVQRVDVNEATSKQQTTQIYLGVAVPANRLSFASGSNPRQTNSFAVSRTDLVTLRGDAAFQPLFQLASASAFLGQGWQIESIAVMGNP
jgi:hypothetical protein